MSSLTRNQLLEMFPLGDPFRFGEKMDPITALIGGGISAGTSIISGLMGKSAADKAAQLQATAAQKAADLAGTATSNAQTRVDEAVNQAPGIVNTAAGNANTVLGNAFNTQTANLNPYLAGGTQGVTDLAAALAPGGALNTPFTAPTEAQVEATPGYQFQLDQGLQATKRAAAASGTLGSGGTLKALTQYSQGLASTNYQNAYQNALTAYQTNRNNLMQGLTALTGVGQTATGQLNQAAQNYGAGVSGNTMQAGMFGGNSLMTGANMYGNFGLQGAGIQGQDLTGKGNAQASGVVGGSNALTSGLTGATGAGMNALTLYSLLNAANSGLGPNGYVSKTTP